MGTPRRARSRRTIVALATAISLVFGASPGFATGPVSEPATIVAEGFEPGTTPSYAVQPHVDAQYPGWAYWGPITQRHRSGSRALWCSGSTPPSVEPFTYAQLSAGMARFNVPQLADYYSARVGFYYTQPSVGQEDKDSFNVYWNPAGIPTDYQNHTESALTSTNAWAGRDYDLSTGDGALSRRAGVVTFKWVDMTEIITETVVPVGEGPSIDDVSVRGWKYGPVRSLTASLQAASVRLNWERPYRAVGSTLPEDRTLAYRVFSAPGGTQDWTELTVPRLGDAVTSYDAAISSEGPIRLAVQAADAGTGTGAGIAAETTVTIPSVPPTISLTSPAAGFSLTEGPVVIGGAASDIGSGVGSVELRVVRSDGSYWNGSGWVTENTWLPAYTDDGWATWSYAWIPQPSDFGAGQSVAVTARVTDRSGQLAVSRSVASAPMTVVDLSAPSVSLLTPAAGFGLSAPVFISGTATDSAGNLASVRVQIRRAGRYWNPLSSGWQSTPVSVLASGTETWSLGWTPDIVASSGYEPVTIMATAYDTVGNNQSVSVTSVDPKEPSSCSAKASATTVSYGQAASITASLTALSGTKLAGRPVVLQNYAAGRWRDYLTGTTGSEGTYSWSVKASSKTSYRVAFRGDAQHLAAPPSAAVAVTPRVYLSAPYAPTTARRYVAFTSWGNLKPRHTSGSRPVRILRERYLGGGKWRPYGYVNATAYNYSSYSRYKAAVKLSYGTWRLRAYAPADSAHAATYSPYSRSVRVK